MGGMGGACPIYNYNRIVYQVNDVTWQRMGM